MRWHPDEALGLRLFILGVVGVAVAGGGALGIIGGISADSMALSAVLFVIALNTVGIYRHFVRVALAGDQLATSPRWRPLSEVSVKQSMREMGSVLPDAGTQFLAMLTQSRDQIVRIVEVLKPLNRSTEITSTFDIRVTGQTGDTCVVPLTRRRRGHIDGGTAVTDHEGHVSPVLPRQDVIAYALLAFRTVARSISRSAETRYVDEVEPGLLGLLCATPGVDWRRAIERLASLGDVGDVRVRTMIQTVRLLAYNDFTCIEVTLPGASRTLNTRRWRGKPEASRLLRFSVRRRDVLAYDKPASRFAAASSSIRSAFGIPASVFFVRLDEADRAQLYHAELIGPEHTFLARQTVYDEADKERVPSGAVAALQRLGQRHAHLYLKPTSSVNGWRYAATFYERMPSSLAPIAVSAVALTILVGLALVVTALNTSSEYIGHPAFSAALLGVPSAISLWAGVHRARTGAGGTVGGLFPLLGSAVTIALALLALLLNVLDGFNVKTWALLSWLSLINAILLVAVWLNRSRFLHSLLYFDLESQYAEGSP